MVADFLICRALMVIGHAFLNQPPLWKPHIERWPYSYLRYSHGTHFTRLSMQEVMATAVQAKPFPVDHRNEIYLIFTAEDVTMEDFAAPSPASTTSPSPRRRATRSLTRGWETPENSDPRFALIPSPSPAT
ncbi:hypothetical protein JHK87_053876 [Glycine soja]|nr:hypothetical protein JHK87_053876 [Glycine soja]